MTYVNPAGVITCGVLFPILGAVAVAVRFILRRKRRNDLRADDWICLPALVSVHFGDMAAILSRSANGKGLTMDRRRPSDRGCKDTLFRMALTQLQLRY